MKNLDRVVPVPYVLHQGTAVSDIAENGFIENFYPVAGVNNDCIEFKIEGNAEQFIHPNLSYIYVKGIIEGKTTTGDKSFTSTGVQASVVNNLLGSLFTSIDIELNNTKITQTDTNYSYIAYLESLLNYGVDAKNSSMQLIGWSTDTAGQMDSTSGAANKGLGKRRSFFNDKGQIELIGKLTTPLFNQPKVLPTMVTMRVTLHKQKPKFYMMHEAGDFSFKFTEAILMMQKTVPVPGIREAYLKLQDEGKPALIHVTNALIKTYNLSDGLTHKSFDNLFLGKMPRRVIIGFVDGTSYLGDISKNPFNFRHNNIAEICLYKDGAPYPRPAIKMDFENNEYAEAYHHFLTSIKARYSHQVPYLTASDYKAGFTLFSWDMSPDQLGSMHPGSNVNMNSNIRLEVRFHSALSKFVTMLVYYELPGTIEIHKDRQIAVDWM